jgi:hypothetical protein
MRPMISTLSSDGVQTLLTELRALAAREDEAAKLRVRAREAQLGTKVYGRDRGSLLAPSSSLT